MPGGQGEDPGDDLLAGLGGDRPVALRAVPLADAGEQDAEVVVDLGDRADGRPRVAARRSSAGSRSRGEAVDVVDLGLGHLAEELAGVAGEALDVPPLPLGVERVEGERALARAADAGEADQLAAGQVERDVAEVVLAGAADHDVRRGHPWWVPSRIRTRPLCRRNPADSGRAVEGILYTCPRGLSTGETAGAIAARGRKNANQPRIEHG